MRRDRCKVRLHWLELSRPKSILLLSSPLLFSGFLPPPLALVSGNRDIRSLNVFDLNSCPSSRSNRRLTRETEREREREGDRQSGNVLSSAGDQTSIDDRVTIRRKISAERQGIRDNSTSSGH